MTNPDFLKLSEEAAAIEKREKFERELQNIWGHSNLGVEAKRAAMSMLSTKNGMYAKIPITCKAEACPYAANCRILQAGLAVEGELCPIETAEIELRYQAYSEDFDLENSSFVDRCLVNEIINADIMMERCKALLAEEGIPVVDMVIGVNDNGDMITQPSISKYWEAYERASKKRNDAYGLMKATRKDEDNETQSITKVISEAIRDPEFLVMEDRPEHLK